MSAQDARGPEEHDAPLEWRAPSDYCAATARGRALTTEALPEVISS